MPKLTSQHLKLLDKEKQNAKDIYLHNCPHFTDGILGHKNVDYAFSLGFDRVINEYQNNYVEKPSTQQKVEFEEFRTRINKEKRKQYGIDLLPDAVLAVPFIVLTALGIFSGAGIAVITGVALGKVVMRGQWNQESEQKLEHASLTGGIAAKRAIDKIVGIGKDEVAGKELSVPIKAILANKAVKPMTAYAKNSNTEKDASAGRSI